MAEKYIKLTPTPLETSAWMRYEPVELISKITEPIAKECGEFADRVILQACYEAKVDPDALVNTMKKVRALEREIERLKQNELPCAVGDKVFIIDEGDGECTEDYVLAVEVSQIFINKNGIALDLMLPLGLRLNTWAVIGKNVFLTKEDAEEALAERSRYEA